MRLMIFTATDRLNETGAFALRLAERARELGHEPVLVGKVFARGPAPLTELGAEADRRGVPFRIIVQRFGFDPGLLGQMELLFTRLKPTVFVSDDLVGMAIYRMGRWRPPAWLAIYRGFPHPLEVASRGAAAGRQAAGGAGAGRGRPAGRGLGGALRRRLELNGLARAGEVFAATPGIAAGLANRKWAKAKLRTMGEAAAAEADDIERLIASSARLAAAAPRA